MPCYTMQATTIEWGKDTDPKAMLAGLEALGLSPNQQGQIIYFQGGEYHCTRFQLTIQGNRKVEERSMDIKKMYLKEATRIQAKKFGYLMREGKNKFTGELVKRRI